MGASGRYILTATDTLGFSSTAQVQVIANTAPPVVDAGLDQSLSCRDTAVVLQGGLPADPRLSYAWTSSRNLTAPTDTLLALSATQADTFFLRATDRSTGCTAVDVAVVTWDTLPPSASAGPNLSLDCAQ
ncbi:hypothetical protein RZS08_22315, partial [Arthrospira platensis SPKY1]|nr:hypothetical protein [Arthrospira platensis SPKY1]